MLTLPGAGHGQALSGDGRAFRVVADATAEFLRWSLYGDAAAKRRLARGADAGDVATLDNQL
jgi:hypothetical protein